MTQIPHTIPVNRPKTKAAVETAEALSVLDRTIVAPGSARWGVGYTCGARSRRSREKMISAQAETTANSHEPWSIPAKPEIERAASGSMSCARSYISFTESDAHSDPVDQGRPLLQLEAALSHDVTVGKC